ncbi:lipopolysaccharide kinase InaA family protein [Halopseudomonas pachastrellae]|nr:lipopolysaccharide kinase InaA family protein [Halopseudomonas pachastrellae]
MVDKAQPAFSGWVARATGRRAHERRDGNSGVQRLTDQDPTLYLKRQTAISAARCVIPLTSHCGARSLGLGRLSRRWCACAADPLCGARKQQGQWQGLLVTEELRDFISLDEWYAGDARAQHGEAVHRHLLRELASCLSLAHNAGLQHGCLYSKHIFIRVRSRGVKSRCSTWRNVAAAGAAAPPCATT